MKPNVVVEINSITYGTSRRAGSVSLLVSGRQVEKNPDVLFIRNPLERLASSWAFFKNDFIKSDINEFIDRVLSGWENPHWIPQSIIWSEWGELRRFERLSEVVSRHENKSTNKPTINYRCDELSILYAADLELYAKAG